MQKFHWREFRPVDIDALAETRDQFHQALQSVAAVGRKFLPAVKNDENGTLVWVPGLSRLAGNWVTGSQAFRSSISFEDFCIYLVDDKVNTISKFELEGKKQSQVLIWLEEQIGKLGLDAFDLTMNLPYKIPQYPTQSGAPFSADLKMSQELSKYYHNTFVSIRELSVDYGIQKPEIKIWPHHFDLATSIILKDTGDDETNTSLQMGISPGDHEFDQPYFYVNTWPHVDTTHLDKLSNGALWHEDEWTGAVLLIKHVMVEKNQKEIVDNFFRTTSQKLIALLKA